MKNERTRMLVALLCSAGAPLACSGGGAVNIGNTEVGSQLSDYAASWDGYVEAYSFTSGSDRLRLTIDSSGQGTLRVGDATLLSPPTDPTVGYPPSAFSSQVGPGAPFGSSASSAGLNEGFLYPLHAARVQTDRIQLGIVPSDLWATWCSLQTPVATTGDGDVSYGCVANLASSVSGIGGTCAQTEPDGTSVPIDCGKLSLCQFGMVCSCTSTSCASVSVPASTQVDQYPSEIDGALDNAGSTLTGTLVLPNGPRVTVVLQKQ